MGMTGIAALVLAVAAQGEGAPTPESELVAGLNAVEELVADRDFDTAKESLEQLLEPTRALEQSVELLLLREGGAAGIPLDPQAGRNGAVEISVLLLQASDAGQAGGPTG